MQHNHVMKKLNFDLLIHPQGLRGGGLRAKYLQQCCCILDSPQFAMQHDHVLKKLNFDLLAPSPGSGWVGSGLLATILLLS